MEANKGEIIIMKYYSEEDTRDLRLAFEKQILCWPRVSTKKMFGCPCYKADGRLFAFLVTDGIVITKLSQPERKTLSHQYQATFFQAGKKVVQNWLRFQLKNQKELDKIMPFVKRSYKSAIQEKKGEEK